MREPQENLTTLSAAPATASSSTTAAGTASAATIAPAAAPDIRQLKTGLRSMWMTGNYDRFSRFMDRSAREFYERLDVAPGSRLLDVACGSGQLALIAAREGADVTGVDIAANLVANATARARAENLSARFEEGDAESLRFEDGSFDVVTSLIGAMFAPRPDRVARELLRVTAPGGTIAMANWTAEGFVGRMFKTISGFIAPNGMPSPLLWGNEERVRERFAAGASSMKLTRRMYLFDYPFPPEDVVEFFRLYYGPTHKAFASLDEAAAGRLRGELVELWSKANRGNQEITIVEAEYLEVVAERA
ncbi:MAG TPA: class I SAM-dependent methyltransferase [Verrucomicrobiae bacterium]|nr:class I SAM-dependent methyltransferase [Verrucomicrobiae bacterium]